MTDYGFDISTPDAADLDPLGTLVTGARALGQALARRLVTPRGGLLDDPSYGYDLRQLVGDVLDPLALETVRAEVLDQLRADERVDDASVTVTQPTRTSVRVEALVSAAAGPFRLVIAVSAVTSEILALETL